MKPDCSILKLDNFLQRVGGIENLYEIRDQFNRGFPQTKIAVNWRFSKGQFCDYFNNAFQLVAVERPEVKAHIEWLISQQQAKAENQDERVREATGILRLLQSGNRKVEGTTR
jgi:hypothetical protein